VDKPVGIGNDSGATQKKAPASELAEAPASDSMNRVVDDKQMQELVPASAPETQIGGSEATAPEHIRFIFVPEN
jgi:hypothetical protein